MRNFDCWYEPVCENECSNTCVRFLEMSHLMESSGIPKNRQKPEILTAPQCDYNAFCKLADIKSNIVDFVNAGKSLYITSATTGNGKTTWAIKLLCKYFDEIWAGNGFNTRGLFINVPSFLLKCKDFNSKDKAFEECKRLIPNVDIVVWDDLGGASVSGYDVSQLLMYIDARVSNNKTNIYTSNLADADKFSSIVGVKIASRVFTRNTEIIEFKGADRR